MGQIRYAVVGRWDAVPEDQAVRILEAHERRYRARLWSNPAVRLQADTETLRRLTGQITEQTEDMRTEHQQRELEASDAAALDHLRETYGR